MLPQNMPRVFSVELANLHRLCWLALMAALMAAGALFHLNLGPVPVTFQDLFVALAGLVLGPRLGFYAVGLYILAGCAGLPVFAGGKAGLGHLIGPTGGYLAGFLALALCAGLGGNADNANNPGQSAREAGAGNASAAEGAAWAAAAGTAEGAAGAKTRLAKGLASALNPALARALAWIICGWALLYVLGASWLMWSLDLSLAKALSVGVLPFIPAFAVKAPLCVLLWRTLQRRGLLPA